MSITAAELAEMVEGLHWRPQDFEEGNIEDRIMRYDCYELKEIPIADLLLDEFEVDDDMVEEFMQAITASMPPIVFDQKEGSIIDGIHRANARHRMGYTTIMAYVSVGNPNYELDEEELDEEDWD